MTPSSSRGRRALLTVLISVVVAVAWSQAVDRAALGGTDVTLKRALTAFAAARALNGVISVAQGTELAIQPVGVGVTLSVGEILDPLNDLVENFSWLALLACVSLGTQMLLADVVGTPWTNGLLSAVAVICLVAMWVPAGARARTGLLRAFTLLTFARFLFALVALATGWVDRAVLADRQQVALNQLELTQAHIEELQRDPPTAPPGSSERSVMERFGAFLDEQRQAMDIKAQLDALTNRVEQGIEELINLLVVFTVQTILVPVAALLLAYWSFGWLWRWSWQSGPAP